MTTANAQRKGKIVPTHVAEETVEEELQAEPEIEVEAEVEEIIEDDFDEDEEEYLGVEHMPDDEELFPNGPRGRELKAWKVQFGEIYVTSFDVDTHVVWRPMNRFEYRRLVKNMEQAVASGLVTETEANLNNEEAVCELCVLFPTMNRSDSAGIPAGIASVIAQEVMEASSFVPLEVRKL